MNTYELLKQARQYVATAAETIEYGYGLFIGGDPRDFIPSEDECTEQELENHRKACLEAEKNEKAQNLDCPSGWFDGVHITKAPFGIGTYKIKNPHANQLLSEIDRILKEHENQETHL